MLAVRLLSSANSQETTDSPSHLPPLSDRQMTDASCHCAGVNASTACEAFDLHTRYCLGELDELLLQKDHHALYHRFWGISVTPPTFAKSNIWSRPLTTEFHHLPTCLPYKRAPTAADRGSVPQKDQRCDGFKIMQLSHDDYFGFTLDGNGRCLLVDFVVTYNTLLLLALSHRLKKKCGAHIGHRTLRSSQ